MPTVQVEGLREFQRALRSADRDLPKQMRRNFNEVAEMVTDEAKRRVPVQSGALRDSIRPLSTQRVGEIRMGYESRVPYAGWIEFGGNHPHERDFHPEGRYLFPVAEDMKRGIQKACEDALRRLAQAADLA